jgi:hypothetical protein
MRGSPHPTLSREGRRKVSLDNIPRYMYRFTICSVKEAVIAKPHLFMLNVEQLPSVPSALEAPW